MNNADALETASSLFHDTEIAAALAAAEGPCEPGSEGPAEVVAHSLAALADLLLAGQRAGSLAILGECEAIYRRTARQLADWRYDAGCADWTACDWSSAEVQACSEADEALARLRARLLQWAAGVDPVVAVRIEKVAALWPCTPSPPPSRSATSSVSCAPSRRLATRPPAPAPSWPLWSAPRLTSTRSRLTWPLIQGPTLLHRTRCGSPA